jgi:two-component system phosphate regulon response regulator PhoB
LTQLDTHTQDSFRDLDAIPGIPDCRRVMIIERDTESAAALEGPLAKAGFSVSAYTEGEDVIDAINREHPHLVMLDWELPGAITMNLIKHIQYASPAKRIRLIALSPFASEQQIISGYDLGADAYVVKPYSIRELVARVKAILRPLQRETDNSSYLQFQRLQMDVNAGRLNIGSSAVSLRPIEFRLLEFLLRHPERAFSRQHLLDQIWGRQAQTDVRAVDVNVQRLRRALAPHRCDEYLQTIRSVGYRISANIKHS